MIKIVIDPGHGGSDSGANHNGILEKNLNLDVALKLRTLLECNNIEVTLTREDDSDLSLRKRCDISNSLMPDLFISIHHNAGGGSGYEIYHYTGSNLGSNIAQCIDQEFIKLNNRRYVGSGLYAGNKKGDYYVLKKTKSVAALTEFCFIDNKEDMLKYDANKQANAIYLGICKYMGIKPSSDDDKKIKNVVKRLEGLKLDIESILNMIR